MILAARSVLTCGLLSLLLAACSSTCPPSWLDALPENREWHYAAGSCGLLGLEIRPERVALNRAARTLAERLDLDVQVQLTVTRLGERLVVEAYGAAGPNHALDALEFVESTRCGERVHVLLRLPAASARANDATPPADSAAPDAAR
ncbi:MAG: hypothetical protein DHS20C15_06280 [Planctomycetota bacterium]|nr:MAG: hypothetical protein DHS20C15_06280 [Planctomycetota bacterium]